MNDDALDYLSPPLGGFWSWSTDGEAILWRYGQVLTFRKELAELLGPWQEQGLPALSAVLLVIAATRDNWPETSVTLSTNYGLTRVYELPRDLRTSRNGRHAILATIFEDADPVVSPRVAADVCHLLQHPSEELLTGSFVHRSVIPHRRREDLSWLETRTERIEATRLKRRMATSVEGEVFPSKVSIETSPAASRVVRDLLLEWRANPEWCGIATVAQQLIAVLSLPRAVSQRDERPHGGVSDITNRGTLDRLLLTELANDDLTLATRIAMNEAMYLRREQPPTTLKRQRVLLMDCGLRQWGVPRLFATSVALALMANRTDQTDVDLYQACGTELNKIKVTDSNSALNLLRLLRPEIHVGEALPELAKITQQFTCETEVVIITSPEGAEDLDFLRVLSATNLPKLYIVTVRRNGECRLWERGEHGRQLMKSMSIDLRAITDSPPVDPRGTIGTGNSELPAILRLADFPLRLNESINYVRAWSTPETTYAFTGDRRLLAWDDKQKGAIQVTDRASVGDIVFSFEDSGYDYAVVRRRKNSEGMYLLRVQQPREIQEVQLQLSRPPDGFFFHQGWLVAVHGDHVSTVNLTNGQPMRTMSIGGKKQQVQRFFYQPDISTWFAICPDVLNIRQEQVDLPVACRSQVALLFEALGVDGPIALLNSGRLYLTGLEREVAVLPTGVRFVRCLEIVDQGRTLLVETADDSVGPPRVYHRRFVVDVVAGTSNSTYSPSLVRDRINSRAIVRSKRNRFRALQIDANGRFLLFGKSDSVFELQVKQDELRLLRVGRVAPEKLDSTLPRLEFESGVAVPGVGYEWSVARSPDGSSVFLDSRGLLHLQSSNSGIPETTLVLTDGAMAGWNSLGHLAGDSYYLGTTANVRMFDFFEESIARFVKEVMTRC